MATKVFDIDATSNTVFPSTFVELKLDMFPYPETWVPSGDTMPTTIGIEILESETELVLKEKEEELLDDV
jgi:hypothetical protein